MAAEGELKINVTPQVTGLNDLIEQLRRTGMSLEGLADSLQRLSDGGADAARTVPDTELIASVCPWLLSGQDHEAHRFSIKMDVNDMSREASSFDCPGHPVRPWHLDSR